MGSTLWEQKNGNVLLLFLFFCRSALFCGHLRKCGHFCRWPQKHTDLRNCSRLSKHCTKPASEDQMCPRWASFQIDVPKVDLIFKFMCPRWVPFPNFKLAGRIQKRKYRNNCRGNKHFFCVSCFFYFSGPVAVDLREKKRRKKYSRFKRIILLLTT